MFKVDKLKEALNKLPYTPAAISCFFGALAFLIRLPFVFRYDLFFGADPGICYLMAFRIFRDGDRPFYFFGTDYQGAPAAYLAAFLFKVFGPSIPLAAAVSLLHWAAVVAIGVYLILRATSKSQGIFCGLIAVVGVPYTLVYVTVPYWGYPGSLLIAMLVLLQAYFILEKGPSALRFFVFGFLIGFGWYVGKHCLPGIAAALAAFVFLRTPPWRNRGLLAWLAAVSAAVAGFVCGYFPEIWYRFRHPNYRNFAGVADVSLVVQNLRVLCKALLAYFDGHPFSRVPEDLYFYHGFPSDHCANALDYFCAVLSVAVVLFTLVALRRSLRLKNIPLFLLAALILFNLAAVAVSRVSNGDIFCIRRYLYPSSAAFSLLTGCFFLYFLGQKWLWIRWGFLALALLFTAHSAFDQYALLRLPDSQREFRWLIQDMEGHGYDRGISAFGPDYTIDALSNERVIVAERGVVLVPGVDGPVIVGEKDKIPFLGIYQYFPLVSQADRIAVIGYKDDPPEGKITFNGNAYRPIGPTRKDNLMVWTPYQKIQTNGKKD